MKRYIAILMMLCLLLLPLTVYAGTISNQETVVQLSHEEEQEFIQPQNTKPVTWGSIYLSASASTEEEKSLLESYGIAAVIGLLAAVIITGSMRAQMKTARKAVNARNYIPADGIEITDRHDRFSHTSKTERKIQSNSGKK